MKKPTKPVKKIKSARVVFVEVSRLYSLPNYQNVKYTLGAEIPRGGSAKNTFIDLVSILNSLRPLSTPSFLHDYERASQKSPEELTAYEKSNMDDWRERAAEYYGKLNLRKMSIERLDALGGAMEERDAKENWQDDDTPF